MKIFIVIPFYNERLHISGVVKQVSKHLLPIVLVDDGSTDGGPRLLNKKNIILLQHRINIGKGAALKTGAEYAFRHGADAVIFMDGDGQHTSEDLDNFIDRLKQGDCDAVFGSRNFSYGVPLIRFIGNKVASALISLLFGIYISDVICGFRAVTKKGYEKIKWVSSGYGVETEMVIRTGRYNLRYTEVPVKTLYHNSVKGVTILDAFGILAEVIKWRLTL